MTHDRVEYLGSAKPPLERVPFYRRVLKKVPLGFLLIVGMPTAGAGAYYGFVASPVYVSETTFVVRSATQNQLNGFGMALQGMGLSSQASDAFAVHSFISSRQGLEAVERDFNVRAVVSQPGADLLQRYPNLFESKTKEDLFKAMRRFVVVGYDSQTGISTLRASAFRSGDAHRLATEYLRKAEERVNQLNERALASALERANERVLDAVQSLGDAQSEMAKFRASNGTVDPNREAVIMGEVVADLTANVAKLKAEYDQVRSGAPSSPLLPDMRAHIDALESQIAQERGQIAGSGAALSRKIGAYEQLLLNSEVAARELASAKSSLELARQDVSKQQLYLETISAPSRPDAASQPRRLRGVLMVLLVSLLAYGAAWLGWASVREHRQI